MPAPTRVDRMASAHVSGSQSVGTFDCLTDDLIVVKAVSGQANTNFSVPTGVSGASFTSLQRSPGTGTVDGSYALAEVFTCVVTSDQSVDVAMTHGSVFGYEVVVYRDHGGIGVFAETSTNGSGTPTITLTGVTAHSTVEYVDSDWLVGNPAMAAYLETDSGFYTQIEADQASGNYTYYFGYYSDTGSGGDKHVGQTSPLQRYAAVAVEVIGTPSAPPSDWYLAVENDFPLAWLKFDDFDGIDEINGLFFWYFGSVSPEPGYPTIVAGDPDGLAWLFASNFDIEYIAVDNLFGGFVGEITTEVWATASSPLSSFETRRIGVWQECGLALEYSDNGVGSVLRFGDMNSGIYYAEGAFDLGTDEQHHIVCTSDSFNFYIYVDGTLLASFNSGVGFSYNGSTSVWGGDPFDTGTAWYGLLDEAIIYSYSLTDTQVAAHYAAGSPSGSVFTQAVNVAVTGAGKIVRRAGKRLGLNSTGTIATRHAITRSPFLVSASGTPMRTVKVTKKPIANATGTPSVSISRLVFRVLSATATATAVLGKRAQKKVSNTVTGAANILRSVRKSISLSSTGTPSIFSTKVFFRTIALTVTGTASSLKRALLTKGTTATGSPSIVRRTSKVVPLSVTGAVNVVRGLRKTISASSTATASAAALKVILRTIQASVTGTGSLVKRALLPKAVTVTGSPSIVRGVAKKIAASVTGVASTVSQRLGRTFNQAISATVTGTANASRRAGKLLSAVPLSSPSISRQARKNVPTSVSATPFLNRRIPATITTAVTGTVTTIKAISKNVLESVTGSSTVKRDIAVTQATTSDASASIFRRIPVRITATVSSVADAIRTRVQTVLLSVTVNVTSTLDRAIARFVAAVNTANLLRIVKRVFARGAEPRALVADDVEVTLEPVGASRSVALDTHEIVVEELDSYTYKLTTRSGTQGVRVSA